MLSRTLGLATVMLLIGWFADSAAAQNLEAGKSPSQIFSGACAACHRSPRGLLKTVAPGSLPGFLREHYTTSRDMAATMAGYLTSNGASDPRGPGGLTKQGQEAKSGSRTPPDQAAPQPQGRRQQGQQEAARPDADGLGQPVQPRRRRGPDAPGVEANAPADAGPGTRAKQKLGKRRQPPKEEPVKPDVARDAGKDAPKEPGKDEPKRDTASPTDAARPDGSDLAKESARTEPSKPSEDRPSDTKPDTAAVTSHPDPVPQVTPAPKQDTPAQQDARAPEKAPEQHSAPSASVSPAPVPAPPPAASPPSGPPTPPISQ